MTPLHAANGGVRISAGPGRAKSGRVGPGRGDATVTPRNGILVMQAQGGGSESSRGGGLLNAAAAAASDGGRSARN